jgi:hypothetical protein
MLSGKIKVVVALIYHTFLLVGNTCICLRYNGFFPYNRIQFLPYNRLSAANFVPPLYFDKVSRTATLTRAETNAAFTLTQGPSIDVHWIRLLRQFIPIQRLYSNVWGHPACRDSLDVNATATHTVPRSTHEYCIWDIND